MTSGRREKYGDDVLYGFGVFFLFGKVGRLLPVRRVVSPRKPDPPGVWVCLVSGSGIL